jgi:hypothetical protein
VMLGASLDRLKLRVGALEDASGDGQRQARCGRRGGWLISGTLGEASEYRQ